MKNLKSSKRKSERGISHVTTGSVLDDLGFDKDTLQLIRQKIAIHKKLIDHVKSQQIAPKELEKIFAEPQPRVSEFMRGKIGSMSLDKLFRYACRLGVPFSDTYQDSTTETRRNRTKGFVHWVIALDSSELEKRISQEVEQSERRNKPICFVQCGSLLEGILEAEVFGAEAGTFVGFDKAKMGLLEGTNGGTMVFLNIEKTSVPFQKEIFRFIQTKRFCSLGGKIEKNADVQIIVHSALDIVPAVNAGQFDLNFYHWLRESVLHSPEIRISHSSQEVVKLFESALRKIEKHIILDALRNANWNFEKVAQQNHWSVQGVKEKAELYGLRK